MYYIYFILHVPTFCSLAIVIHASLATIIISLNMEYNTKWEKKLTIRISTQVIEGNSREESDS